MASGTAQRLTLLLVTLTLAVLPLAADPFVNFEEPQTQPITVFNLTSPGAVEPGETLPLEGDKAISEPAPIPTIERRFLAVANTPDNSVEIYDANYPWPFVTRLHSGHGPVTLRWNNGHKRLYACNFSGDSVSVYKMSLRNDGNLVAQLERIVDVGDEPSDIAFSADNTEATITLSSQSGVTIRDAVTLSAITTFERLDLPVGSETHAVKAPRQIWIDSNDRKIILNLMGEIGDDGFFDYDLDLYVDDPVTGKAKVEDVGSTHHAFAVSPDHSLLFVAGTRARHLDPTAVGVAGVSAQPTGFVESWFWTFSLPSSGAPSLVAEAPAGAGPWPTFQSINLNRDYTQPALTAVAPADALSQPTDIAVISGTDNAIDKIFITAFHSDAVARLRPDVNAPGGWDIHKIAIPVLSPVDGYSVAGPRGLAVGKRLRNEAGSTETFVFANNRLDNTVVVISAGSEQIVGHFPLQNDPTDLVVRTGRKHLYNAASTSGSGIVACASCHVDARTDGLGWNLGGPGGGPAIGDGFHDQNGLTLITTPEFPEDKGLMITQNLLGLVNYPINEGSQFMFTNAPYHWRGDKPAFDDFNEAFVNLQGTPDIGDPGDPKGLTDADMRDYRLFVNTLRHPPNPDQALDRRQSGILGAEPDDPTASTGANLGMAMFHLANTVGNRACIDCHSLPEGSSNTATIAVNITRTTTSGVPDPQLHPIETAALRNVRQRERQILTLTENTQTANFGLMHDGFSFSAPSLEQFGLQFTATLPGPDQTAQVIALIEFLQQYDTGIAPTSTLVHTLGQANDTAMLDILEDQVLEANADLAVLTRKNNNVKGYWYDITASPPVYREEGTANTETRANLEARAASGETVVFQGCPLGTSRRWASAAGVPSQIASGQVPGNITLEAMAPPTPWVGITGINTMAWAASASSPPTNSNMWTRQAFQQALIPTPSFGVDVERHEPARRFRVSGDNILPGALLHIGIPTQTPQSAPIQVATMELYPTQYTGAEGRQIWETSQELAPYMTLALLNGGFWAPDVAATFLRTTTTPNLQPNTWNGYLAVVQNEDGTISNNLSQFQVLTVQDGR